MRYTLLLASLVVGCLSYSLPRNQENQEKTVTKRHASWPWFVPAIFIPQVVEVHHVVYLQRPDSKCFPNFPRPTPGPETNVTETPGIDNRFGETNTTATPSRCVWAIVGCCSPGSRNIRYSCFELLGCQGAFWDASPCQDDIVRAAANTALNFYMTNNNETQQNEIPTILNN